MNTGLIGFGDNVMGQNGCWLWVRGVIFAALWGLSVPGCSDGNNGNGGTTDVQVTDTAVDTDNVSPPEDMADPGDVMADTGIDVVEDTAEPGDINDTLDEDGHVDVVTPPEDMMVADVENNDAADTTLEPDIQVQPETRVYRVKTIQIDEPALCYDVDQDGSCDDLTAIVNALLQGQLDTSEEPLDLLGIFPEFVLPSQNKSMVFGEGSCDRDPSTGVILGCTIGKNSGGAVFDNVFNKDTGICSLEPEINAPCFATTTAPSLSLAILGIPFEFNNAKAAGGFDSNTAPEHIEPGILLGFMSVAQTKSIGLELGQPEPTPLFDLLKSNPPTTLEDGTVGWMFHLSFTAIGVPEGE